MRQVQQRGSIKLSIVIATALGLGFVASAYLNFYQHQQFSQQQSLLNGQITDLRYQVKVDHDGSPSPSPSASLLPTTQPTPNPSSSPSVAGAQSLQIAEWAVHLSIGDPVGDLTYGIVSDGQYKVTGFTSSSLLASYPSCKPGALGELVRWPVGTAKKADNIDIHKTIGNYNYYYKNPTFSCANDTNGRNLVAADKAAIVNTYLPTLSQ